MDATFRMTTERPTEVTDYTDNGRCIGCGSCCTNFLPMSQNEVEVIKRYIKLHGIHEQKHGMAPFYNPIDCICPFMDSSRKDKKKCTIYPVRPKICRIFNCSSYFKGISLDSESLAKMTVMDVRGTFFNGGNYETGSVQTNSF